MIRHLALATANNTSCHNAFRSNRFIIRIHNVSVTGSVFFFVVGLWMKTSTNTFGKKNRRKLLVYFYVLLWIFVSMRNISKKSSIKNFEIFDRKFKYQIYGWDRDWIIFDWICIGYRRVCLTAVNKTWNVSFVLIDVEFFSPAEL